ncbi:Uncaracterized surface protein containing fasciclin (FAS1) repeats [Microlunatus sagamiharensis]|uniref:Uncaracterized surface protein containing fasciclin (FAS1) repeats n=1 Tax=Microlunatus sagamiharensis TaxID=546874 RepID=A0A1H2MDG8_9ACTN|nr:fasciclin domain-containing protein [Microlunatus sagamiharensis]SDU90526.1 Uncaracterized surface protein containing fasciclin (FAS1) repeats [Microlunatus sagamiharensis]
MFKTSASKIAALAAVVALPLSLAACGDTATDGAAAPASSAAAPSSAASSPAMSPSASASSSASDASAPFGSGCSAVPTSGKGSFDGMSQDPVATAASNNPALSTLVSAVKAAGLVDTLNNAEDITVFAPTNDAFKKIPAADLKKVLNDKKTLTAILTGHVTSPKLAPTDLAGDHTSLAKTTIKVTGSGEDFTVDGSAKVVCGNVQTANATVYIIDSVLLPKS